MNNRMALVLSVVAVACAAMAANVQAAGELKKNLAASAASIAAAKTKPVTDATTGIEFVFVKGGCYKMGDTFGDGGRNEGPEHDVCVSDFYLGKYEVTQSQWNKMMESNPSTFKQCGPDCPVDSVSWDMAQEYIRKLNAKSGKQYRLPTEAEWEYAARSGGKDEKWAGIRYESDLGEYAWYEQNSDLKTHKVGLKKPNGLGLYDMSGNVREWCLDWYGEDFYSKSPKNNPAGEETGEYRVQRGADWEKTSEDARLTYRNFKPQDHQSATHGFRLLLPIQ